MADLTQYNIGSFFAGVGGIELGFKQAGFSDPVYANEFDKWAQKTYQANWENTVFDTRDICTIDPKDTPDMDIIMGGFPCQAFSIAGKQLGFDDIRGTMFFEMMRFVQEKQPQVVFAENVKNLQTHDGGTTFQIICGVLEELGYTIRFKVLNAKDYGNVPQNRERIYIVAFKDANKATRFSFPAAIPLVRGIRDVIDFETPQDERYYYSKSKYKDEMMDTLARDMDDKDAIYQWRRTYVRKNKSGVVPTLTANQGTGGHNVCLIRTDDGRIRKMTPRECFNAQGFPQDFILPQIADCHLYKQAGNSVCVPVVKRIAESIALVL